MITIDWLNAVIHVPQSYLTPLGNSRYQLDVNQFRLDLKNLEDDADGMSFPDTHRHTTPPVLSGIVYPRTVEILAPYSVTFEDGQYAVFAVGANHNLADVKTLNQVSLITQNSAGLITVVSGSGVTPQDKQDIADLVTGSPKTLTVGKYQALK